MKGMTTTHKDASPVVTALAVAALVALGLLGLVIWGLWSLADGWTRPGVNGWAVAATLLLVPAFLSGFWFGKTEVRGFLSGADHMLDRMAGIVQQVATIREATRTAPRPGGQPPAPAVWGVAPPPPLQITYRTGGPDASDDL